MAGFRFRHLISAGSPSGERSAWSPLPPPAYLGVGDSGATGIPVYVAPPSSPYDSLGTNPDVVTAGNPIQTVLGIYVLADQAIAANSIGSTINFDLYRAGAVIGGGRFAGWNTSSNPAFVVGVPVFVPFDVTNTALKPVPNTAGLSSTQALLPLQALDAIVAVGSTVADFVGLWACVNAQ